MSNLPLNRFYDGQIGSLEELKAVYDGDFAYLTQQGTSQAVDEDQRQIELGLLVWAKGGRTLKLN